MNIEFKIILNKKIRSYDGDNAFLLSLKKQLKTTKNKEKLGNKLLKVLSDRQYDAADSILNKK